MTYNDIWRQLSATYEEREAKAVARTVLEDMFGLTYTDIICGETERLTAADTMRLERAVRQLADGEPVQYVTGVAQFSGRTFHVRSGVLIPRPETEQLCSIVSEKITEAGDRHARVLDIGTGSGCVAITVALDNGESEVVAWDISDVALNVARDNAQRLGANVDFVRQDVLDAPDDSVVWNVIVSNPPYICDSEKKDMEDNVLLHEPHLALFVPDDDPLLFYRSIARYAVGALKPGGWLLFEINAMYAKETESMLMGMGFEEIETRKDIFGKNRNTICRKPIRK